VREGTKLAQPAALVSKAPELLGVRFALGAEAGGVAERGGAILSACACYIGSAIGLAPSTSLTATRTPTRSIHEDTSIRFLPPLRLLDRRSPGTSIGHGT
jgi:hypothetical protein